MSSQNLPRIKNILPIPKPLEKSSLMEKGGYEVFEGFIASDFFNKLQSEAFQSMENAVVSEVKVTDFVQGEERGGTPARKFLSAPGGNYLATLCKSQQVLDLLSDIVGLPVIPTGEQGTFTYYINNGDHLSLHRDIMTCDLAVITSLYDNTDSSSLGGVLALYPERHKNSLSEINSKPEEKRIYVKVLQGQTIVMLGGIVPHLVLPMNENEKRIISILCYKVVC